MPAPAPVPPIAQPAWLPHTLSEALWRGARGHCPRCGTKGLFARFLKPIVRCRLCGQDWTVHAADDFPPYVSIIITGHVLAPVLIMLALDERLSLPLILGIALTLAAGLMLALLQPAKGAIIALQWWMGMHGFSSLPGRREAEAASAE